MLFLCIKKYYIISALSDILNNLSILKTLVEFEHHFLITLCIYVAF